MSAQPKVEVDGEWYYPAPYSNFDLDRDAREWQSMIIIGSIGLLSFTMTLVLASFIVFRFLRYRWRCQTFEGYNQYVILVLNLLIADCQQAMGFVVNFRWVAANRLVAPSTTCSAQGWLLNTGNVSSGLFVLLIALHTLITAAYGKRISLRLFTAAIFSAWFLTYFMTAVAWSLHGQGFFVKTATWCWISPLYEPARLMAHYFWLFLAQGCTIIIYVLTYIKLRRTTTRLSQAHSRDRWTRETIAAVRRISTMMMLYPAVYVVLTVPISAGRMWSWAHRERVVGGPFMTIAASLLTSCGWIDCILYTMTRRRLMQAMIATRKKPAHNNLQLADVGSTLTPEESGKTDFSISELLVSDKDVLQTRPSRAPRPPSWSMHIRTDPRDYRRRLDPIHEYPDPSSCWFDGVDAVTSDLCRKYRRRTVDTSFDINSIGVIPPVYSPASPCDSPAANRPWRNTGPEPPPGSRLSKSKGPHKAIDSLGG